MVKHSSDVEPPIEIKIINLLGQIDKFEKTDSAKNLDALEKKLENEVEPLVEVIKQQCLVLVQDKSRDDADVNVLIDRYNEIADKFDDFGSRLQELKNDYKEKIQDEMARVKTLSDDNEKLTVLEEIIISAKDLEHQRKLFVKFNDDILGEVLTDLNTLQTDMVNTNPNAGPTPGARPSELDLFKETHGEKMILNGGVEIDFSLADQGYQATIGNAQKTTVNNEDIYQRNVLIQKGSKKFEISVFYFSREKAYSANLFKGMGRSARDFGLRQAEHCTPAELVERVESLKDTILDDEVGLLAPDGKLVRARNASVQGRVNLRVNEFLVNSTIGDMRINDVNIDYNVNKTKAVVTSPEKENKVQIVYSVGKEMVAAIVIIKGGKVGKFDLTTRIAADGENKSVHDLTLAELKKNIEEWTKSLNARDIAELSPAPDASNNPATAKTDLRYDQKFEAIDIGTKNINVTVNGLKVHFASERNAIEIEYKKDNQPAAEIYIRKSKTDAKYDLKIKSAKDPVAKIYNDIDEGAVELQIKHWLDAARATGGVDNLLPAPDTTQKDKDEEARKKRLLLGLESHFLDADSDELIVNDGKDTTEIKLHIRGLNLAKKDHPDRMNISYTKDGQPVALIILKKNAAGKIVYLIKPNSGENEETGSGNWSKVKTDLETWAKGVKPDDIAKLIGQVDDPQAKAKAAADEAKKKKQDAIEAELGPRRQELKGAIATVDAAVGGVKKLLDKYKRKFSDYDAKTKSLNTAKANAATRLKIGNSFMPTADAGLKKINDDFNKIIFGHHALANRIDRQKRPFDAVRQDYSELAAQVDEWKKDADTLSQMGIIQRLKLAEALERRAEALLAQAQSLPDFGADLTAANTTLDELTVAADALKLPTP